MRLYLLNPSVSLFSLRSVSSVSREWIPAITDRKKSDVDHVKDLIDKGWNRLSESEKNEWISGLKGALNKSDLLRIESNVQLLSDVLELDLSTYADNIPNIPDENYYLNLLKNVSCIREASCIHKDTPQNPKMPVNEYRKINDIEKILEDVYSILKNNFHYYCGGEIYAGDIFGALL